LFSNKSHILHPVNACAWVVSNWSQAKPSKAKQKWRRLMVTRILYICSKPAVTAISKPIRAGKFYNSHLPIRDWIVCGAGQFTPICTSLEAVWSSLCGPHHTEWRQNSHFARVSLLWRKRLVDKQIQSNNKTKKSIISLRQKNK
jgi:hypothetical protein